MKRLTLILSVALLVPLTSVEGDTEAGPTFFINGLVDLATAFNKDGLPQVNRMRRGDSPFDNLRLTLFGDVAFNSRIALFNQVIFDPTSRSSTSSFLRSYVRFTALETAEGDLHLEAGKIPTAFGTFGPRAYSNRNPLISPPLMYHYFTSLRSNQLPADNADLLAHRGEGPSSAFGGFSGGGSSLRFNGLPIIYDICWDFGIQAVGALWRLEYLAALTQGTLSDPRTGGGDNNDGKQVVLHLGLVPAPGLVIGASYARGPYLDSSVGNALQGAEVEDFHQEVIGFDLEFGIRHFRLIAELAANRWESPNITDGQGNRVDLKNVGWYVEGKYTLSAGFYASVRYGRITFGEIDDGSGNRVAWDEPVERWESGLGFYFWDGVVGKVIRQDVRKERLGTPGRSHESFWATQLSLSF